MLALCNPLGSDYLIVLYVKSLKIYNANMLSRQHPSCSHYFHWDGPPASFGELLPSPGGRKLLVWRWLDVSKKIFKSKSCFRTNEKML